MSEVTWTDPLVFVKGLKNSSSDLRDLKRVGGLYSRIHLCPFFVISFLKSSCFNSIPSLLFLPQALVLSVSSSMKEPKRVSSQLWLAMHCCTTSSWPGSSAACSMVLVWNSGTETQTTVMPRLNWGEESIYKLAVWIYLTAYISVASCKSATFSSMFILTDQALKWKYLGIKLVKGPAST